MICGSERSRSGTRLKRRHVLPRVLTRTKPNGSVARGVRGVVPLAGDASPGIWRPRPLAGPQSSTHGCGMIGNLGLKTCLASAPTEQAISRRRNIAFAFPPSQRPLNYLPRGSALLLTHREYPAVLILPWRPQHRRSATRASSVLFSFFPFLQPTTSSTTER